MSFVTGGELVAKALKVEGIEHIFTLCGGHVQMIYDGCLTEGIRVVDVRHEQTAGFAADGYARASGKPGVAVVTAGPGVTNVVTAVANAMRAQVPMVVIGGQAARNLSQFGGQDRGALQEMNHLELMRPITKWAVSVPETRRIQEFMQSAFRVATSGVPGPVFLEIPLDILMMGCDEGEVISYSNYRTKYPSAGDPRALERAAEMLSIAKRPLIILGSQWRWSPRRDALYSLLERHPIPTFVNGMARGALPLNHPCRFIRSRSKALKEADLVMIFGTPLDFRLRYGESIPEKAKLIQVDLDASEIGRNRRVDLGIVGDTGLVLYGLTELLGQNLPALEPWLNRVREFENQRLEGMRPEMETPSKPINPLYLCSVLNQFIDDKTVVIGDGGDFVASAAYILDVRGVGSWMDPGPLGTLGVGPGYAMAAKLARPDHRVIWVAGDGSFGLNAAEIEALVRQEIKITCIIGNDGAWTQILRGQKAMYGEDRLVATKLSKARYDLMAKGLGAHGEYVTEPSELKPALERAFNSDKTAVVNVEIGGSKFREGALAV